MKYTGKYSQKRYRCVRCGHEELHGTNHWGQIYPACRMCSWKHPLEFGTVWDCLEPRPKGMGVPRPWTMVKLGDLLEVQK